MSIKTITGRLGADVETRMTQNGKAVVSFSVAETKRKFNRDSNQWEDDFTIWHDVESWQNTNALGQLRKGELVIVHGEERDASYEHRETGKTVRRIVVRAQAVGILVRDGQNQAQQGTDGPWGASQALEESWSTPTSTGAQTGAFGGDF
jgi:single-strand DNA-binding protein